jgi:hypothetical protein
VRRADLPADPGARLAGARLAGARLAGARRCGPAEAAGRAAA